MTRPVERDELADMLSYAMLKVPPSLRQALASDDAGAQRHAEAMIADRIVCEMRHLEVIATPAHAGVRAAGRQAALPLPLPVTEADLPY